MNKFEEDYEDYYDYEYDEEGNIIGFKTRSSDSTKSRDKHPPPSDFTLQSRETPQISVFISNEDSNTCYIGHINSKRCMHPCI